MISPVVIAKPRKALQTSRWIPHGRHCVGEALLIFDCESHIALLAVTRDIHRCDRSDLTPHLFVMTQGGHKVLHACDIVCNLLVSLGTTFYHGIEGILRCRTPVLSSDGGKFRS